MRPVLFHIGPMPVSSYWFFVLLGGAFAARFWYRRQRDMGLKDEAQYWLMLLFIFIGALVGGKLAHLFLYNPSPDFWTAAKATRRAYSILGDIAGPIVFVAAFARLEGLSYWRLADYIYLMVPIWDATARMGCLANGCCYGRPTDLPWGIIFPTEEYTSIPQRLQGVALHPTQLYELAAALATGWALYKWALPRVESGRWRRGTLLFVGVGAYGLERFVLEHFRADTVAIPGGLSSGQAASIGYLVFCASGLYYLYGRGKTRRRAA